jgi:thioester reductase-like protein
MTHDPLRRAEHFAEVPTHWAAERPHTLAFRFLTDRANEGPTIDYGQLDASARRIAAAMVERAGPGERALLIYAPGLEFIEAFVACLYAGITAVPVYPPTPGQLDTTLPRLLAIARDADVRLALSTRVIGHALQPLLAPSSSLTWIATDEVDEGSLDRLRPSASAPVVLQYTSGSTGEPKGVIVSHANLLHDQRAIRAAFGHDQSPSGVSWLPTYHDMGLMGKVLQTIYLGTTTSLLSPLAFIKQPLRWLEAISRFRATTSGGPDFAYALCTRRISEAEIATLDLSSWRVAFCGAEPIRLATLDAFADKFAACGFRREALFPCYGLAESTLMVSGGWLGREAAPLTLRREALERKRAVLAAPGTTGGLPVVSCGPLVPGMSVAIVDAERRERVGVGELGEIWLQGPSVAQGYWRDEARTVETFRATLADGSGPWLRTGDLGFVHAEQLYVTGRSKELLVVHGRNVYPQDIEATVAGCHAAIRAGGVAAFAIDHAGQDHAALVVELGRSENAVEVELAIRRAVSTQHGVAIARLALVPLRTLPKTSSGKLQRTLVRERLLVGAYDRAAEVGAGDQESTLYAAPNEYFRKIESRNTHYRFDIERDVAWDRVDEPGVYFTARVLGQGGIDLDAMARVPGLVDEFQWALAVAIAEEFVALELRILGFLREEQAAGRLPSSRSTALFDTEEIKHVQLFRRYADELQAARPERAAELHHHLQAAFASAWWHDDAIDRYPDPAVYHFVHWLHFVFFEEYSIYLHTAMAGDPSVQPAWLSAHAAHMREERQHVVTDAAHLERLILDPERRREWSKWFLDRSSRDASGLAGLEGVWTYLQARYPALASLSQPGALLANLELRKRSFLRLLTRDNGFGHTLAAATGFDEFVRELESTPTTNEASDDEAPASERELELRGRLVALLADALNMEAANVDLDQPLLYFGLDSVQAVQIAGELERIVGVELPPTLLFEHPDVRALARAIAAIGVTGTSAMEPVVQQHRAPTLDLDLDDLDDREAVQHPRHVLLTGATGFLCGHLLAELLERSDDQVRCLVRAPDEATGRARLRANLDRYGLWRDEIDPRIDVVLGDLAAPRLGLTREAFVALADDTDEIFHGGALVDFIQPYERLEAVNVGGTHELIRLAVRGGNLPFNLISTIGIFDTRSQSGARVGERDVPDEASGFRNGYGRSKWAAEQLAFQVQARGLPVRVFRPGIVSGSTITGAWQPDMVAALIKSFVESGCAIEPSADGSLDAAPVDYVARAIVAIAARGDGFGQVFHLDNPRPTPWKAIYAALAELGHPLRLTSYAEWLSALAGERADPALKPFLAYFKTRDEIWKLRQPIVDCTQTLAALAGSGVECPVIDAGLLRRYLDYFERVGFIRTQRQAVAL